MHELRERRASFPTRPSLIHLVRAVMVAGAMGACHGGATPPSEVPVFPGASLRASEGAFQTKLLALLSPPGSSTPRVEVYATPAAFAAVAEFYDRFFVPGSVTQQRFAVASRMRELADGVRAGGGQQLAVGRLLFARGAEADSLSSDAIADSLANLADRFQDVEGLIALGRIQLATAPPSEALVSIERPHLSAESRSVDSSTVVTFVVRPVAVLRR
jgi:hypothetical protein